MNTAACASVAPGSVAGSAPLGTNRAHAAEHVAIRVASTK
jgi:hypothetical protein